MLIILSIISGISCSEKAGPIIFPILALFLDEPPSDI